MFVVLPVVPNCIYTNPEIATVGITEATAHKYHMKVKCGQAFMDRNGKSIICRENGGFIRLIFEAYSNTLVGAQMMCPRATDKMCIRDSCCSGRRIPLPGSGLKKVHEKGGAGQNMRI